MAFLRAIAGRDWPLHIWWPNVREPLPYEDSHVRFVIVECRRNFGGHLLDWPQAHAVESARVIADPRPSKNPTCDLASHPAPDDPGLSTSGDFECERSPLHPLALAGAVTTEDP